MERQTSADFLSHGCAGAQAFLIPIPATQSLSSRAESQGGRRSQICHQNSLLCSKYGFIRTQHFLPQANCSKVKELKRRSLGRLHLLPFIQAAKSDCQPVSLIHFCSLQRALSLFFGPCPSLHNIVPKQKTQKRNNTITDSTASYTK